MGTLRNLVIFLTAAVSIPAWPCGISQTAAAAADPLGYLERSELVLSATVVRSEKAGQYAERVELHVQRAFKGASGQSRMVLVNFLGETCSQPLETGKRYLLFARPFSESDYPGQYQIIGLSGEEAIKALAQLEGAAKPQPGAA